MALSIQNFSQAINPYQNGGAIKPIEQSQNSTGPEEISKRTRARIDSAFTGNTSEAPRNSRPESTNAAPRIPDVYSIPSVQKANSPFNAGNETKGRMVNTVA